MQTIKHLKDRIYYEDRYDRRTVEDCRLTEEIALRSDEHTKNLPVEKKAHVANLLLYFETGERYKNKEATIKKWMDEDRALDERYENTPTPQNVSCKFCKKPMELWHKWFDYSSKQKQIEFTFSCEKCRAGKKIYDNGKVVDIIPWKCPGCSRELKTKESRKGNKITIIDSCVICGYKKTHVIDLDEKITEEKPEPPEKEKIQFEKDRDRFCLSHEKGMEYLRFQAGVKRIQEIADAQKNADKKPAIKTLTVPQVQTLIKKEAVKHGYEKLSFGEPRMGRDVDMDFKIYDKIDRSEYDSRKKLKKLLETLLKDTNWKLMSDGIDYRLGILTGTLKALEKKPDFMLNSSGNKIIY